jgi:hypothetical protein
MQLSAFDSSHRIGVGGTPEVLIPVDAMGFFPATASHGSKYDDAQMRVILNHPSGPEIHDYRLWIYTVKSENRLRMNHRTIDLTNPLGGDLLVVSRLTSPAANYEVTIVPQSDPSYQFYLSMCTRISNGKLWGIN